MAGMPRAEVVRIAKHVEAQGVHITRTKKGLFLRLPDGQSAMMHFTTSDVNAIKNLRAQLHRSGVSLPNDRHDLGTVPAYARRNSSKQTLERVRGILDEMGRPQELKPGDVVERYVVKYQASTGSASTVVSALHNLGYYPRQSPAQAKNGSGSVFKWWERDLTAAELAEILPEQPPGPELERAVDISAEPISHQVYALLSSTGRPWSTTELRAALAEVNESTLSSTLNALKTRGMIVATERATYAVAHYQEPTEPEPEPEPREPVSIESVRQGVAEMAEALRIAPDEPDAREFIDSVDSWAVSLQELDPATTVAQLLTLYTATRLAVELRVWRQVD